MDFMNLLGSRRPGWTRGSLLGPLSASGSGESADRLNAVLEEERIREEESYNNARIQHIMNMRNPEFIKSGMEAQAKMMAEDDRIIADHKRNGTAFQGGGVSGGDIGMGGGHYEDEKNTGNLSYVSAQGNNQNNIQNNANSGYNWLNPNNLRAMASIGKGMSQNLTPGEYLGDAAQDLIKRDQFQKAMAKLQAQQEGEQSNSNGINGPSKFAKPLPFAQINPAMFMGMLGPKEDNNTFDGMNIKGDGSFTLSGSNAPPQPSINSYTDKPLEGMKNQQIQSKGIDFSPFL